MQGQRTAAPRLEDQQKKKALVKEVINVHDEAMPWMETSYSLKKQLNSQINDSISDSLRTELQLSIQALDASDEHMMRWMRDYAEPSDTGNFESAIKYLNAQKQSIVEVRTAMKQAIDDAKKLTKNE